MICFLGMLGFAGWLLYGYTFVLYCTGLFMAISGLSFLGIGIYSFQACSMDTTTVNTYELVIKYRVYEGRISGYISKRATTVGV